MGSHGDMRSRTLEHFAAAPFEPERWDKALLGLADMGGGAGAQLIGFSSTKGINFDWISGIPREALEEFERRDGTNPKINPRAAVALAPLFKRFCDYDVIDEKTRSRHPFYQDFLKRVDASFLCGAVIHRKDDFVVVPSVLRSERTGHVDALDVRRILSVFPNIATAVKLKLALEHQGTLAAAGALSALSIAAIFCDPWHCVIACSKLAQRLLTANTLLRVRNGRLEAIDNATNRKLDAMLSQANSREIAERLAAFDNAIPLDVSGLYLRIAPLPRETNIFGCGASAIVMVENTEAKTSVDLLRQRFSLTLSEAKIALLLSAGKSIKEIADMRKTSTATVRVHLKTIYGKANVHRQAELVAILSKLPRL